MGRKNRNWTPHFFYHIVCRGNRRDSLFKDDNDFLTYLYILELVNDQCPFELASYCLMTNHIHLQLRSQEQHISKVMSLINKRYADYYNLKNKVTGHVFEKRYYDEIINTDKGMLEVSRYIHLNPVDANMVARPEDYRWSSVAYYKGMDWPPSYLKVKIIKNYFSGDREEKETGYYHYLEGKKKAEQILLGMKAKESVFQLK